MDLSLIKYVAAYLRKSRGESDEALAKHRQALAELAEKYGWKAEEYQEISNADSIEWRPEMLRLLRDVESGIFDAVLVMDLDRLSRGDMADQGKWRRIFETSGTMVITPTQVYNLADDSTALMADIEGVFARHEYRMITKRLRQGKRMGAKQGKWTNGPAPMPYFYDPDAKQLVVDPEKLPVYNLAKERVLANIPLYKIAVELNVMGIPSPKGGKWVGTTVHRLVTSEVHLGRIVSNKTAGSGHKKKQVKALVQKARDEWIVAEGTHQPVKTTEEHARILETLERRQMIPRRARQGRHVLSGLVRCGLCGSSMQFLIKTKPERVEVKKCQHMDPYGKVCTNRGVNVKYLYDALRVFFAEYRASLKAEAAPMGKQDGALHLQLKKRRGELAELEAGGERIQDLYVMGRLTKADLEGKLKNHDELLRKKREEVGRLEVVLAQDGLSPKERLSRVDEFMDTWTDPDKPEHEKNRLLGRVISRLVYTRIGDEFNARAEPL